MAKFWMDGKSKMKDAVSYNFTPSLIAKSTFFYMQSMGHFHCDRDYYTKREGYGSYLLIYTVSGKGFAEYRGRSYELRRGQVLLMDCRDYQEYRSDREDLWEIKWIHFNGSSSDDYFGLIYSKYGPVIDMQDNLSIPDYLGEVVRLVENNDFQLEVKVSRLLVEMLSELLLSGLQENEYNKFNPFNENVKAAIEFVEENFHRSISLKDMAAAVCSSEYHFSRVFKRVTGYSPYEYLIKFRINRAKSLLKGTNKTIEEIAVCVGFCSISNFIRTFRELEAMTPFKYRRYWMG